MRRSRPPRSPPAAVNTAPVGCVAWNAGAEAGDGCVCEGDVPRWQGVRGRACACMGCAAAYSARAGQWLPGAGWCSYTTAGGIQGRGGWAVGGLAVLLTSCSCLGNGGAVCLHAPPSTGAGPREVTLWCNALYIYSKQCDWIGQPSTHATGTLRMHAVCRLWLLLGAMQGMHACMYVPARAPRTAH
jgi:hypothetical protein